MKTLALLTTLGLSVSGCDVTINEGINLGGEMVVDTIGLAVRGHTDTATHSSDPDTSVLVCNPVGEKVVDPTTECHSETKP